MQQCSRKIWLQIVVLTFLGTNDYKLPNVFDEYQSMMAWNIGNCKSVGWWSAGRESESERIKCKMDGERPLTELLSGASSGELYKSYGRLLREREKCGPQIRLSLLLEIHSFLNFLCGEFLPICENILKKNILSRIPCFLEKSSPEIELKFFCHKSPRITYNMIECIRFFIFILWVSPNLAKCTYGWLPLEQHHKITGKKLWLRMNMFTEFCIFFPNFKTSFHSPSITLVIFYLLFNFVMLLKWPWSKVYWAKSGDIQNTEVEKS